MLIWAYGCDIIGVYVWWCESCTANSHIVVLSDAKRWCATQFVLYVCNTFFGIYFKFSFYVVVYVLTYAEFVHRYLVILFVFFYYYVIKSLNLFFTSFGVNHLNAQLFCYQRKQKYIIEINKVWCPSFCSVLLMLTNFTKILGIRLQPFF